MSQSAVYSNRRERLYRRLRSLQNPPHAMLAQRSRCRLANRAAGRLPNCNGKHALDRRSASEIGGGESRKVNRAAYGQRTILVALEIEKALAGTARGKFPAQRLARGLLRHEINSKSGLPQGGGGFLPDRCYLRRASRVIERGKRVHQAGNRILTRNRHPPNIVRQCGSDGNNLTDLDFLDFNATSAQEPSETGIRR